MVKSTRNVNSVTPIVALASFDREDPIDVSGSVFDAVLAKPIEKADVCAVLPRLGFTPMQTGRRVTILGQAHLEGMKHASGSLQSPANAPHHHAPEDAGAGSGVFAASAAMSKVMSDPAA